MQWQNGYGPRAGKGQRSQCRANVLNPPRNRACVPCGANVAQACVQQNETWQRVNVVWGWAVAGNV